jgi:hypothetical protein
MKGGSHANSYQVQFEADRKNWPGKWLLPRGKNGLSIKDIYASPRIISSCLYAYSNLWSKKFFYRAT